MNASLLSTDIIHDEKSGELFSSLYTLYATKVYKRCLVLTRCSYQAEDFTHDIFLKVFANLNSFQERSTLPTWLWAITNNYCLDQLRLRKRLTIVPLTDDQEAYLADSLEAQFQEERIHKLNRALATLSPADQKVFRLKYEDGLKIETIAQLLNLTLSAVKMRLKRGRQKVHQYCHQAG